MPEFVMEGRDHARRMESEFVFGFIEAMFFTECDSVWCAEDWFSDEARAARDNGQCSELPVDVGYVDLHPDSLAAIRRFCETWQAKNAAALARACVGAYDEAQAGRDLWYTINGHGVGFWDRRGDSEDQSLAFQELDQAAKGPQVHVFFGDHVAYGDSPFVHVDL